MNKHTVTDRPPSRLFSPPPPPQFKQAMVKNFSSSDLNGPTMLSTLVRAASKLSLDELSKVAGGSTEDTDAIIAVSYMHSHAIFRRNCRNIGGNSSGVFDLIQQYQPADTINLPLNRVRLTFFSERKKVRGMYVAASTT